MSMHVASMADEPANVLPTGAERLREAALGVCAAILGIVFILLLAADQAQLAAGV